MLRVLGPPARLCDGISRRQLLQVGALGTAGLTLPRLLEADGARTASAERSFGRARSCILLFLTGGPPQQETWDPKPDAAPEVRGPVGGAIPTNVPGLQVGELMPLLARQAHRCAVIRSVATDVNAHTGSGYWMLTGRPHPNRNGESLEAAATDWPHLGAVAKCLLPARPPLPAAVTLPEPCKNNPGILWPGQTNGFLPPAFNPFLLECDPSAADFRVAELTPLPELPPARLSRRRELRAQVNDAMDRALRGGPAGAGSPVAREESLFRQAFDLVTAEQVRRAFDLRQEPARLRERYGPHKFGQSCLLARRLVEAGARLVTVNWPREPGDLSAGNPVWDTHSKHAERMRDHLMPPMDRAVSALLEDLAQRGLLDETLVVWMGEFGRTPKFNPQGGRDHWGHVFSVMLAGGGIRGGTVHGASDHLAAYPETDRVGPEELHATIYHCLGIPPDAELRDRLNRTLFLREAEPVRAVLA